MIKKCLTYLVTNLLLLFNFYGEIPKDMNLEYKDACTDIEMLYDFEETGIFGEYQDENNDENFYEVMVSIKKKRISFRHPTDRHESPDRPIKFEYFQIDWKDQSISFYKKNKTFIITFKFIDHKSFVISKYADWFNFTKMDSLKIDEEDKKEIMKELGMIITFGSCDYDSKDRVYIDPYATKK
ncbi:MAG: hypothetical protein MJB14_14245 [Spirochaetes bacterium]|nr:hypothetical protein [Spirochaetota bacterium]